MNVWAELKPETVRRCDDRERCRSRLVKVVWSIVTETPEYAD